MSFFSLPRIQKRAQSAADAEYPSYGVTGPNSSGGKISPSSTMSDRKLAQSAQMYHYQQQRQQMMAQEKSVQSTRAVDVTLIHSFFPGLIWTLNRSIRTTPMMKHPLVATIPSMNVRVLRQYVHGEIAPSPFHICFLL